MKILIVSNGFPPTAFGGVELYSLDLARELLQRGHQVLVFCRERDPQRSDYETWRDTVEGIPVVRLVNDFKQVGSFRQLYADPVVDEIFARLLDEFQPDLVHFNHFLALSVTLPEVTAQRKIPSVATLHDYWSICQRINLLNSRGEICPGPRQGGNCYQCMFVDVGKSGGLVRLAKKVLPYSLRVRLRRMLRRPGEARILFPAAPTDFTDREQAFRRALAQVDCCVVPSQFVSDVLVKNAILDLPAQVISLGIGFPPLPHRPRLADEVHFAFAGSILPVKGLESLIRAFRLVDEERIRLDIYGREDIQPLFAQHLHDLAAGDERIVFHGSFRPDQRAEIFAQMDVFVMPSVWHETFSYVAREALQAGVPVITARVGALTEVVQEGVNGFLYPPGDENALSEILRRIAGNPELLDGMRLPGPVDILSVPQHVDRIEQVYHVVRGKNA